MGPTPRAATNLTERSEHWSACPAKDLKEATFSHSEKEKKDIASREVERSRPKTTPSGKYKKTTPLINSNGDTRSGNRASPAPAQVTVHVYPGAGKDNAGADIQSVEIKAPRPLSLPPKPIQLELGLGPRPSLALRQSTPSNLNRLKGLCPPVRRSVKSGEGPIGERLKR